MTRYIYRRAREARESWRNGIHYVAVLRSGASPNIEHLFLKYSLAWRNFSNLYFVSFLQKQQVKLAVPARVLKRF